MLFNLFNNQQTLKPVYRKPLQRYTSDKYSMMEWRAKRAYAKLADDDLGVMLANGWTWCVSAHQIEGTASTLIIRTRMIFDENGQQTSKVIYMVVNDRTNKVYQVYDTDALYELAISKKVE